MCVYSREPCENPTPSNPFDGRWCRLATRGRTLPLAVILYRFAADLLVLHFPPLCCERASTLKKAGAGAVTLLGAAADTLLLPMAAADLRKASPETPPTVDADMLRDAMAMLFHFHKMQSVERVSPSTRLCPRPDAALVA